ncbi:endopeptidase La [Sulfobacillus harzensis]|uniref:Lon protease n=1 Tax=Sulfobacillus harzensis TaxID=2729629 RepID=A0A7Y0Q1W2_9FIRM|nr:endopeptidase La [Sulfobacillus harzensis]NMP21256.1 endopeptidase La [Sulfobacillus harzensis]
MELPLLPLRGVLVFPSMVVPLEIGRKKSLHALEQAMLGDRALVFVAQKDTRQDDPGEDDLYRVGIVAEVKQVLKMPTGGSKVVVEGRSRCRVLAIHEDTEGMNAEVEEVPEASEMSDELEALMHAVRDLYEVYVKNSRKMPGEASVAINIDDPGRLADTVIATLDVRTQEKQEVLEDFDVTDRLTRVSDILSRQIELLEIEKRISGRVRRQMERTQKEYYLREQMKAIQRELGEADDGEGEIAELRSRLEALSDLAEPVRDKVEREIKRLEKMSPMSAEAVVVRTYLEWVLELPWTVESETRLDIAEAESILEADHFGLKRVKERILEYLAVQSLSSEIRSPILCLVGPPGVGKTSLARSIARATGRRFVRMSLGGVRDEAEIRGHRRTYIGALPGRIIQGIRQAGTKNPLFLLDEVDKMAADFRGDPAAALLEVLDPEQNHHFSDHYLELPFDLSSVMFITTANVLHSIPRPLLDRMETIAVSGYTDEEKRAIAEKYLWPRQVKQHGLAPEQIQLGRRVLTEVIAQYTREAGVRQLERELSAICRKAAREVVEGKKLRIRVTNLRRYLGRPRVFHGAAEEQAAVGVVTGLAVTETGGDIMAIEAATMPGKGKLTLTGQLGEVMQESAQAGYSYIRAHKDHLAVPDHFEDTVDLHVHVPEGAIPKDGPSAGIAMASAMISALTGRAVRPDVAMTGEITLRGRVLPVGGIKDKILAAHRAGIDEVIIPERNQQDLEDLPANVRKKMAIHLVRHLDDVLPLVLVKQEQVMH